MIEIQRVGVLGTGQMGSGIAQVAAVAGCEVLASDVNDDQVALGRAAAEQSLAKLVEKGRLSADLAGAARERIRWTTRLDDLAGCDLVIEAITEDLVLKNRQWSTLDSVCQPATIFASNTSSLSITAMAGATSRPDRFIGLHFFNPVALMPLVEVVRTVSSSREVVDSAVGFARRLGKEPILARDSAGFIVNLLLVPYMLDAVRAVERGVASVRDIDAGMKLGCGHPMGPLTLLDVIGLDTTLRVGEILFQEYRESRYAPPPLLRRLVVAGHLGKKSGRGFYDWSVTPPVPAELGL